MVSHNLIDFVNFKWVLISFLVVIQGFEVLADLDFSIKVFCLSFEFLEGLLITSRLVLETDSSMVSNFLLELDFPFLVL